MMQLTMVSRDHIMFVHFTLEFYSSQPQDTAHHEAVRLREEHNENIRLFRETIDVNNALMKQIINTIDADYI